MVKVISTKEGGKRQRCVSRRLVPSECNFILVLLHVPVFVLVLVLVFILFIMFSSVQFLFLFMFTFFTVLTCPWKMKPIFSLSTGYLKTIPPYLFAMFQAKSYLKIYYVKETRSSLFTCFRFSHIFLNIYLSERY